MKDAQRLWREVEHGDAWFLVSDKMKIIAESSFLQSALFLPKASYNSTYNNSEHYSISMRSWTKFHLLYLLHADIGCHIFRVKMSTWVCSISWLTVVVTYLHMWAGANYSYLDGHKDIDYHEQQCQSYSFISSWNWVSHRLNIAQYGAVYVITTVELSKGVSFHLLWWQLQNL